MHMGRVRVLFLLVAAGLALVAACGGKVLEERSIVQSGHGGNGTGGPTQGGAGGSSVGGAGGSAAKGGSGLGGAGQGGSVIGPGGAGGAGGAGAGGAAGWAVPSGCIQQYPYDCNPLTNEPCSTAAGEACDISAEPPFFVCYPAPNDAGLGKPCDLANGPFCKATMTCVPNDIDASFHGNCRKFCCSLQDCPAGSAVCAPLSSELGTIGSCE